MYGSDEFLGKVAVITGASGNLGSAIVRALKERGAKLALIDKNAESQRQKYPELADSDDYLLSDGIDLTQPDQVKDSLDAALSHFGRIDILINSAGGFRAGKPIHETSEETWQFMLDLNAGSVFSSSRIIIPMMIAAGGGKIVNVAARAGLVGAANMSAYSVSKSAVVRLTESIAAEVGDSGINVNCVLPGTIDTPQNRQAVPNGGFDRWVKPADLAEVILFLSSDHSRAITGAAIPVYGRS